MSGAWGRATPVLLCHSTTVCVASFLLSTMLRLPCRPKVYCPSQEASCLMTTSSLLQGRWADRRVGQEPCARQGGKDRGSRAYN